MTIRFLMNNLTYVEGMALLKAFRDGDIRKQYGLAGKAIISWDYEFAPSVEAVGKLPLPEAAAVMAAIMEQVTGYFADMEADSVETALVDLSVMTLDDFTRLDQYARSDDYIKVERLLRLVRVGWDYDKEMDFPTGAETMTALRKAYAKALSGKN